jgi:DUF971 family protein
VHHPTDVQIDPEKGELVLTWSDGQVTRHRMDDLRRQCPCATCRGEREKMARGPLKGGLRVISGPAAPAVGPPRIVGLEPVGRYALKFTWNDGHSTGIYTYEFLRTGRL